jgi:prephenate dehydrogenase
MNNSPLATPDMTVGIIGGQGQFGKWVERIFAARKLRVLVSDIGTSLSNLAVAEQSDIVVVCVPISTTADVIREISVALSPQKLIADMSSVKAPVVSALAGLSCEVLSLHPMFSPRLASHAGQTCVVCPVREGSRSAFLREVLGAEEIKLVDMSLDEHDRMMAVVQGITHFQSIVAAHAMMKLGVNAYDSLSVASPVYRLRLSMIGRILAQDPKLYAEIQIYNPYFAEVLQQLQASSNLLAGMVLSQDVAGLSEEFLVARDAMGEFVDEAWRQSEEILSQLKLG